MAVRPVPIIPAAPVIPVPPRPLLALPAPRPVIVPARIPVYGAPELDGPATYDFSYGVEDAITGTNFGHSE